MMLGFDDPMFDPHSLPPVAGSAPSSISVDSFTDVNGTAITVHSPDSGPAWQEGTGGAAGYTIDTNRLVRTDPVNRHAFMDVGTSNVKVSCSVVALENLVAVLVRRSDNNHYWELFYDVVNLGWQLSLVNGGPDIFKGPLLSGGTGTITLEAIGNTIVATSPSGARHMEVDPTLSSNVQVGLIVNGFGGLPSRVDNWSVLGL